MSCKDTIVVHNIDFNTNLHEIDSYFSRIGKTNLVKLLIDPQGRFSGSALVTYSKVEDAQKAVQQLNGSILKGKKIKVEFKKDEKSESNEQVNTQDLINLIQSINNRLNSIEQANSKLDRFNKNKNNSSDDDNDDSDNSFSLKKILQNGSDDNDNSCDDSSSNSDDDSLPDLIANESYQAKIFSETMKIIKKGSYRDSKGTYNDIKKKVADSTKNTMTLNNHFSYDKYLNGKFKNKHKWGKNEIKAICSKIEVTEESTLEAARRIKSFGIKEVVALSFASPVNVGGGSKNNKIGQEEFIVRQSSLYHSLSHHQGMYKYNRKHKNPYNSDFMVYSPNVVVIRDDNYDLIYPFRVSIISASAVNNTEILKIHPSGSKNADVYKCMKNRCRKVLQLAISMNNRAIVLGAFGCGIFGNSAKNVSKIFKELLVDEFYGMFFVKIIFAIKGKPHQKNHNFEDFKNTFQSIT